MIFLRPRSRRISSFGLVFPAVLALVVSTFTSATPVPVPADDSSSITPNLKFYDNVFIFYDEDVSKTLKPPDKELIPEGAHPQLQNIKDLDILSPEVSPSLHPNAPNRQRIRASLLRMTYNNLIQSIYSTKIQRVSGERPRPAAFGVLKSPRSEKDDVVQQLSNGNSGHGEKAIRNPDESADSTRKRPALVDFLKEHPLLDLVLRGTLVIDRDEKTLTPTAVFYYTVRSSHKLVRTENEPQSLHLVPPQAKEFWNIIVEAASHPEVLEAAGSEH
ncbi:hypothetical protein C8R42DRAFT_728922 [Lentinula raphanica]|nr:hypothetical protein C8R42DRAFT_728922 [Lentinula raphanica]